MNTYKKKPRIGRTNSKDCDVMLIRFELENYTCFVEHIMLDLVAAEFPNDDLFLNSDSLFDLSSFKLLPVVGIYGKNASGKTNILRAFSAMAGVVTGCLCKKHIKKLIPKPSLPFAFDEKQKNKPCQFDVSLYIESLNRYFRYGFSVLNHEILEEWLYEIDQNLDTPVNEDDKHFFCKKAINEKYLFIRKKDSVDINDTEKDFFTKATYFSAAIDENLLFLSVLSLRSVQVATDIFNWFHKTSFIEFSTLKLSQLDGEDVFGAIIDNTNELIKYKKLLKATDPCIEDILFERQNVGYGIDVIPYAIHKKIDGCEIVNYKFPFVWESAGCQKFLTLLPFVLPILENGGILLIDELDSSLHPLVFHKLIKLFRSPEWNNSKAQLIFNSHDITILNRRHMRSDEIFFTFKDNLGRAKLLSRVDFKDDNSDAFDYYDWSANVV